MKHKYSATRVVFAASAGLATALAVPLSAVGAANAAPPPAAQPAPAAPKPQFFNNPGGCGSQIVILAPGTTETNPNMPTNQAAGTMGVLGQQVQKRDPRANVYITPYYASVGGNNVAGMVTGQQYSFAQSRDQGVARMTQQVQNAARQCPNTPITLGGYSQGGEVAGSVCSGIGTGKIQGVKSSQIKSCELFGDPGRGTGDAQFGGSGCSGAGILGNGRNYGDMGGKVRQACRTGDPYADFQDGSVAGGLGGGTGGSQSPISSFRPQWAGSNGLPQTLANSLGSFAGIQNHTTYTESWGGKPSPVDSSADFITGRGSGGATPGRTTANTNGGGLNLGGGQQGGTGQNPLASILGSGLPGAQQKPSGGVSGVPGGSTQQGIPGQIVPNGGGRGAPPQGPTSPLLTNPDKGAIGKGVGGLAGLPQGTNREVPANGSW